MKRFKPKGEQRLRQLIVKFGQLTITAVETISEFLDRIRYCKHMRRCFVCNSEDNLARNCPKNPNLKKLKFEKRKRKDKKREIVALEEKSDNNYMSDDSSASSNDSEN